MRTHANCGADFLWPEEAPLESAARDAPPPPHPLQPPVEAPHLQAVVKTRGGGIQRERMRRRNDWRRPARARAPINLEHVVALHGAKGEALESGQRPRCLRAPHRQARGIENGGRRGGKAKQWRHGTRAETAKGGCEHPSGTRRQMAGADTRRVRDASRASRDGVGRRRRRPHRRRVSVPAGRRLNVLRVPRRRTSTPPFLAPPHRDKVLRGWCRVLG